MTRPDRDPRARPSLKDVASLAGVSFQTTSKVLRGGGRVADDTRARIHRAADELGYVPNEVARSLVTRRTRTIGVLVGDLSDHVVARFVVGAEHEARQRDHAIVVVRAGSADGEGRRPIRSLLERRVDGVVSFAPQLEADERHGELLRNHVPSVSIHAVPGGGVDLVGSDERAVGRLAAEHLVGRHGHDRIGMVTGPARRRVSAIRADAFASAVAAAGVSLPPEAIVEGAWSPESGHDAASELLTRRPDLTAVFVHNDDMAVGVLHAAAALGRSLPDDLAVIGCDDVPVAAHTRPPLTTVRLPFHETGAVAVRLLLERLDAEAAPHRRQLLPVELVVRRSCGCVAVDVSTEERA